jgi:tRNA(Ile2) C34 agmatinyltransferase TiaS
MSTLFEVPCPDCGRAMSVEGDGDLQCSCCHQAYHLRMGHLFPAGERAPSRRAAHAAGPATSASS